MANGKHNIEMLKCYLVVHDGSETHDTNVNVVFLTDESRILQGSTTRQSVGSSHQSRTANTETSSEGLRRLYLVSLSLSFFYLMECRAARGAEEDGEGRLQSPWRSSMDRLQGESMDETSPPASDCSPSNLNTNNVFQSF